MLGTVANTCINRLIISWKPAPWALQLIPINCFVAWEQYFYRPPTPTAPHNKHCVYS